jgi:hypothetical protein
MDEIMHRPSPTLCTLLGCIALLLLPSCTAVSGLLRSGPKLIHALPDQEQLLSPLLTDATQVADSIPFTRSSFTLPETERLKLQERLATWKDGKKQLLIAGFASTSSVPDHGRTLAQRRAEAVRAALIEMGLSAGDMHTTSFGSDITALSPGDVVRIYEAKEQPLPAPPIDPLNASPPPAA